MPYFSNSVLPSHVRAKLSAAAQNTYRHAYNRAWQARPHDASRKQIADRIAWEAVRSKHQEAGAEWTLQTSGPAKLESKPAPPSSTT